MVMVAICDDEIDIGAQLEQALIEIFAALKIKHEIEVFFGGAEFVCQLEAKTHYDLIFLDIKFAKEEINGVEIGRLIRNVHQNNITTIVYISWEKEYAMQLFQIRPMDFLVKPLQYAEIERAVRTYLKIAGFMGGDFTYKKGHDFFKLPLKAITHLENRERKVILHLADGSKDEFYGSLKKLYSEQLAGFDFLFIHGSYVVNYDYVAAVKFDQVTLADCTTPLPISPNKRNEVRQRYAEILKRRRL
ncbi:MAG: LytTR family DNA-binding domain-containing protein [Defluviitaleaceae bacterium]|nr:LytTR family DNA-binding domain-containing protein [Defluviitaleaceae bacterium]